MFTVTVVEEVFIGASVVAFLRLEVVPPSAVTSAIVLDPELQSNLKMDIITEVPEELGVVLEVPVLLYLTLQVVRCPRVYHLKRGNLSLTPGMKLIVDDAGHRHFR